MTSTTLIFAFHVETRQPVPHHRPQNTPTPTTPDNLEQFLTMRSQ